MTHVVVLPGGALAGLNPSRVRRSGRKPSSGKTAMLHARAWVEKAFPGAPVEEAKKTVIWIPENPDKPETVVCDHCKGIVKLEPRRRPISRREDLFGCFDLMILPQAGIPILVQVTTWTGGGGPAARRHKVQTWIQDHYAPLAPNYSTMPARVLVMAWVPRKHFRVWEWRWARECWEEIAVIESPLMKSRKREELPAS